MSALKLMPLGNLDIHPSTAKRNEQKAMSKKEDGYTPLPNFVCDEGYLAVLSGEAIKCLVLLNRHINGFHEENKAIGESLILKLTGFKDNRTVRKAMADLAKYNLVKITKTKGKSNLYEVTFDDRLSVELVTSNDTRTSSIKCHSVKETKKETLKESAQPEQTQNPVDEVLQIWKPDLHQLNSWLQRSGLPKINQAQVDELLLEINPHYENKIITGVISDNQMYSNFVKWIKRDTKLEAKIRQQATQVIVPDLFQLQADKGDW